MMALISGDSADISSQLAASGHHVAMMRRKGTIAFTGNGCDSVEGVMIMSA
jgi:hypothetical protein